MQIKDLNIYHLTFWGINRTALFSKDTERIELTQAINSDITQEVFNPEISFEGLRNRQTLITTVAKRLLLWGVSIFVVIAGPLMIFSTPWSLVAIPVCIANYLLGAGIYIALIRGCRASVDEIKFKHQGRPTDFKINQRALVRSYDFLIALPALFFPLLFLPL